MFFAAMAGGFIALPLSDQLTASELAALLDDSGAAALASADVLPDIASRGGILIFSADDVGAMISRNTDEGYTSTRRDDPAFLIYTSGTTARPKGVLHAHRSALGRQPMYQGWYGIRSDDRMLHAGAFNWTFTLSMA